MVHKNTKHVAIIGAGIVGVSTAIWLQRAGLKVTLVDRDSVASGASYGNAGILASSGIIPVTTPGLIFKAPKMLFNPNEPLFLRWSYLPKILPWLVRFLSKANYKDMVSISSNLHALMYDSLDQHRLLAEGTGAEKYIKDGGWLHCYATKEDFLKDKPNWEMTKRLGLDLVEMTAQEIEEFDPALKGKFGFALLSKTDGRITDPAEYIKTLSTHFMNEGGDLKIGKVVGINSPNEHASVLVFEDGAEINADHIVITAGAHSAEIIEKLGYKVPLESERGYHLEFVNANIELKTGLKVASGKFGVNSMNGRLRCAGVVELGGVDAPASRAPFELLKRQVKALFPELEYDEVKEWMGHRPSTSDSLPLIGAFKNHPNIWAGFGHHHLGLTGGPRTGKWLAQLISGKTPNEDISAYDPNRF